MTRIEWAEPALHDRDKAFDDALLMGFDHADLLLTAIIEANRFLAQTPYAGSPVFDNIRRKWRLGRLPYALVYRVEVDRVYVLRLVHLRSDWQTMP